MIKKAILIWLGVGFIVGVILSGVERNSGEYHNFRTEKRFINYERTGCIYKSALSYVNFGYVLGCEVSRRRFEQEGLLK